MQLTWLDGHIKPLFARAENAFSLVGNQLDDPAKPLCAHPAAKRRDTCPIGRKLCWKEREKRLEKQLALRKTYQPVFPVRNPSFLQCCALNNVMALTSRY